MRDSDNNRVPRGVRLVALAFIVIVMLLSGMIAQAANVPWYIAALVIGVIDGWAVVKLFD